MTTPPCPCHERYALRVQELRAAHLEKCPADRVRASCMCPMCGRFLSCPYPLCDEYMYPNEAFCIAGHITDPQACVTTAAAWGSIRSLMRTMPSDEFAKLLRETKNEVELHLSDFLLDNASFKDEHYVKMFNYLYSSRRKPGEFPMAKDIRDLIGIVKSTMARSFDDKWKFVYPVMRPMFFAESVKSKVYCSERRAADVAFLKTVIDTDLYTINQHLLTATISAEIKQFKKSHSVPVAASFLEKVYEPYMQRRAEPGLTAADKAALEAEFKRRIWLYQCTKCWGARSTSAVDGANTHCLYKSLVSRRKHINIPPDCVDDDELAPTDPYDAFVKDLQAKRDRQHELMLIVAPDVPKPPLVKYDALAIVDKLVEMLSFADAEKKIGAEQMRVKVNIMRATEAVFEETKFANAHFRQFAATDPEFVAAVSAAFATALGDYYSTATVRGQKGKTPTAAQLARARRLLDDDDFVAASDDEEGSDPTDSSDKESSDGDDDAPPVTRPRGSVKKLARK